MINNTYKIDDNISLGNNNNANDEIKSDKNNQ